MARLRHANHIKIVRLSGYSVVYSGMTNELFPTNEKAMNAMLDEAKMMCATEKDFDQSMKPLDLKTFAKFDKLARDHKDFAGAYDIGYDAGMGYDLPKDGGLEGNNPHEKDTFAYWLWMDIAGQGMADA
jgi:hypothetical protein